MTNVMQTSLGTMFDLNNPDPAMIDIHDVVSHLTRLCRFTGGLADPDAFYPVSEHLVQGVRAAFGNRELIRHWLAHDMGEAYTGDISRPMKEEIGYELVRKVEDKIDVAIAARFGLTWGADMHRMVKIIDDRMLNTERRDLLRSQRWPTRWVATPYDFAIETGFTFAQMRERLYTMLWTYNFR